jgi:hypothetical protein
LEDRRRGVLAEAARAAARGDWRQAARLAGEAQDLRRDEDSRRLLAVGRLMQGDFEGAWGCYIERAAS